MRSIKPLIDSKRATIPLWHRLLLERPALPARTRAPGLNRTSDQHPLNPWSSTRITERESVIFMEDISMVDIRSSSSPSDLISCSSRPSLPASRTCPASQRRCRSKCIRLETSYALFEHILWSERIRPMIPSNQVAWPVHCTRPTRPHALADVAMILRFLVVHRLRLRL